MDPWPLIGRDEELALALRALTRTGTSALVLTGEAGVGKTRLSREVSAVVAKQGPRVLRAVATAQTRTIPLGAIARLVPGAASGEELQSDLPTLARMRRALTTATDLLLIDDAPHLDDLTVGIVSQLVREGGQTPRLLLTARTDEVPSWLAELAHDDHVQHVRLQPLGSDDVDSVLSTVLPGDVDPQTRSMLWTHSRGNPLLLRRLLIDGIESGALGQGQDKGTWIWKGRLDSADLWSVIEARLKGVTLDERHALDLIAVGEPLPLSIVEDLVEPDCLSRIEAHALIELVEPRLVRIGHPLIGSVLRDRMTALSARKLKGRLADAFVRAGVPQQIDLLRVAQWQLDADCADPALITAASEYALLLDPDLAEHFARAVTEPGSPTGPRHVLARALYEQARLGEARKAYADALEQAEGDAEPLAVMMGIALTSFWETATSPERIRRWTGSPSCGPTWPTGSPGLARHCTCSAARPPRRCASSPRWTSWIPSSCSWPRSPG